MIPSCVAASQILDGKRPVQKYSSLPGRLGFSNTMHCSLISNDHQVYLCINKPEVCHTVLHIRDRIPLLHSRGHLLKSHNGKFPICSICWCAKRIMSVMM